MAPDPDPARRRRKARTRTVLVPLRRRARRAFLGLGGWKGLAKNAMIGLGALTIGNMIASRVGLDPRITGGLLGLYLGGIVGAATAVAVPTLMQRMQATPEEPRQIWG
jgi:hypothetical protein